MRKFIALFAIALFSGISVYASPCTHTAREVDARRRWRQRRAAVGLRLRIFRGGTIPSGIHQKGRRQGESAPKFAGHRRENNNNTCALTDSRPLPPRVERFYARFYRAERAHSIYGIASGRVIVTALSRHFGTSIDQERRAARLSCTGVSIAGA